MAGKLSLRHNKVARRILISFVLAALIPIAILGLLSYQEVTAGLRQQTDKALQKNTKNYALGALDRLKLSERALQLLAAKVGRTEDKSPFSIADFGDLPGFEEQFDHLVLVETNGNQKVIFGTSESLPVFTQEEMVALSSNKTVIKAVTGNRLTETMLWMAISVVKNKPETAFLLAKLRPELLWESDDMAPYTLWVLDENNRTLFASEPNLSLPLKIRSQMLMTNSGLTIWQNADATFLSAYWKLPLKLVFHAPEWVVMLAQPEDLALSTIRQFSAIYPPVIFLAILIVGLLSKQLISKYLKPLENLKAATFRIAEGDFDSRLHIESRDEFETLADSFNDMTGRLKNQFEILAAMSEIDRHILSSLDAEIIVETALDRLPSVLNCDLIAFAKVDPEAQKVKEMRIRRIGRCSQILTNPIAITKDDIAVLVEHLGTGVEIGSPSRLPAYLEALGVYGQWRFLVIPVVLDGTFSSIMCLGYKSPLPIPVVSRNAAKTFGDRMAVALSNAAWEEKLYKQAHFDFLTGLPNRLVLNDRLDQELARSERDKTEFAVFFIDLDRFKTINDSLGHSAGDELLVQVTEILVNCVRVTDLVVRNGGDEFVVVMTELQHQNATMYAGSLAEKILSSLKRALMVAGLPVTTTASIGIALYPGDADNVQDLLKNADVAMYHAKNEGRDNFRFYSSDLNAFALENMKLEHELREAIAKAELTVFYQPKVDLHGRIVGAEALIRWQHPELGMVSPAKFIPLAEQTGLIVDIGHWVFEQTCLQAQSYQAQGFGNLRISVNISAIEFKRPELVDRIAGILMRTGVDPNLIELELTESIAIGDNKNSIERMAALKKLGLTLSMDDFGTGYSSLSYLKNLPLDVIKIDQSFVRHLESEGSNQAIVRAILALANGLGMETVSEGVENQAQLDFLKQNKCDIFQGFLFSRPIPPEDFLKLLTARSHDPAIAE